MPLPIDLTRTLGSGILGLCRTLNTCGSMTDPQQLIGRIQAVLSPDLLKPEYREANKDNPLYGHCYAASEALYHALGGQDCSWTPARGRDSAGVVHWWLENDEGTILDPTADQYTSQGLKPPYSKGRRAGFLTRAPSKRASAILTRMEN